jgi:hypothetical protein
MAEHEVGPAAAVEELSTDVVLSIPRILVDTESSSVLTDLTSRLALWSDEEECHLFPAVDCNPSPSEFGRRGVEDRAEEEEEEEGEKGGTTSVLRATSPWFVPPNMTPSRRLHRMLEETEHALTVLAKNVPVFQRVFTGAKRVAVSKSGGDLPPPALIPVVPMPFGPPMEVRSAMAKIRLATRCSMVEKLNAMIAFTFVIKEVRLPTCVFLPGIFDTTLFADVWIDKSMSVSGTPVCLGVRLASPKVPHLFPGELFLASLPTFVTEFLKVHYLMFWAACENTSPNKFGFIVLPLRMWCWADLTSR